jgi:glycerate kinase
MEKKKIVICSDSFKGTMTSIDVTDTIASAIRDTLPQTEIVEIPIADGGEGTVDCYRRASRGRLACVQARNSNFKLVNAEYFLTASTAIIESASVVGLAQTEDKNPAKTTSYGIGQLIADALKHTKSIILALGGTSTNDGGCGIAAALGARFFNAAGDAFVPTGGTLTEIERIDISAMPEIEMTCMCDVINPMYGRDGAAFVYAPQKGADLYMVQLLDDGLKHLSKKIIEATGKDVSNVVGGGAAGAIAAGMVAFCNAELKSGISVMLDTVNFDERIEGADLIITGEGKLDCQSFQGKVIDGILDRAVDRNIPVIAICGQVDRSVNIEASGLTLAIATSDGVALKKESRRDYKNELYNAVVKLLKKIK